MSALSVAVRSAAEHLRDQDEPAKSLTFSLSGVGRAFGDYRALHPVHLTIREGERVALLGPSGAGKSTLLRLLSTALMPSEGQLSVLGADPQRLGARGLRALRTRIGVIHQQFLLVPQASVFQNVVAGRLGHLSLLRAVLSILSSAEAERVHAVLSDVGLGSHLYERVDHLSGGEQQRVAIARMLYQEPEVIIADEPLASVDPRRATDLLRLLSQFAHERTLIVSTHQIEPVLPYVSRVIGLRQGSILFDKRKEELGREDLMALYAAPAQQGGTVVHVSPRRVVTPALEPEVITVGVSRGVDMGLLLQGLSEHFKARPGLRFKLVSTRCATLLQELQAGKMDLAIVDECRPLGEELEVESLAEDEVLLVAGSAFASLPMEPLSLSMAASLQRIEWEPGSKLRTLVEEHFARSGVPLHSSAAVLETGGAAEVLDAVVAGVGVAFVSSLMARQLLQSGGVRRVAVSTLEELRHPLFAVYRKSGERGGPVAEFLEIVRDACGTLAARDSMEGRVETGS
jgi:phosphonate transport system ATP-binding protein